MSFVKMIERDFKRIILLCILTGAVVGVAWWQKHAHRPKKNYTIGILQTASHPALDAARESFISYLERVLPNKIEFITKNVQGDTAQAYSVAKSFNQNSEVNGLFAIATLAAQAAVQTHTDKPIAIAAVTDPVGQGIWTPHGVVCGSSDNIDVVKQVELMRLLIPSLQQVGILYSLSEPNSASLVAAMKNTLAQSSIKTVEFGISHASDLSLVVAKIADVDLVWVPTDNGVAAALDVVIKQLRNQSIPLMISDNLLMRPGVLAAAGIDYRKAGEYAAQCLEAVLVREKKPSEIPLAAPKIETILVNRKIVQELGMEKALKNQTGLVWFEGKM